METMIGWRWCDKCQGLWQAASGGGNCPAGGAHNPDSVSLHYGLWAVNGGELPPPGYQDRWERCEKCQATYYGPNQATSVCAAGGQHTGNSGSLLGLALNYDGSSGGQPDWRWCQKCQALFYGPNQASSHCPAGGLHDQTGSADYRLRSGPFPEQLNVIVRQRDEQYICLVSSPDGAVAHTTVMHPEVFGSAEDNASGGVIAVCSTPFRTFYACKSPSDNSLLLGSVGISLGDVTLPASTGLEIIGNNGDVNASAPALVYFKHTLYLFYRTWHEGKWGYGRVQCVPITVTDAQGHFTVGSSTAFGSIYGGGRITAVATSSQMWCSYFEPTNPNANGALSTASSSDGVNWTSDTLFKSTNDGSASLLVLPDGNVAMGWRGPHNGLYFSIYQHSGGGYWPPQKSNPFPGVTLLGEPTWMTSADNSSIYLACRGMNDGIQLYKLDVALTAVRESALVETIVIGSTPSLLCLFPDGEPPEPPLLGHGAPAVPPPAPQVPPVSSEDKSSGTKLKIDKSDLDAAVENNILSAGQSENLWNFLQARRQGSLKALNVLAYFGAFIVIASMTWFATKAFSESDPWILLATGAVYFVTFLLAGLYLIQKGHSVPAMLSLTISTFLVPLTVFALQRLLGLDFQTPGNYHDFYVWINQGWFFMEVSTIVVAVAYLRLFPFELLTLPLAFSLWFLSMDLTPILFGKDFDWEERRVLSIWFGLAMLAFSYGLDLVKKERDYSFWLYLFGLLAFWCALSFSSTDSPLLKALYCLLNIGLVAVSLILRRTVFLVFGALGIFIYLFDLADHVFRDSFFFPLYLSLVGIGLLVLSVWLYRKRDGIDEFLSRRIPEGLKRFVPRGK